MNLCNVFVHFAERLTCQADGSFDLSRQPHALLLQWKRNNQRLQGTLTKSRMMATFLRRS